MIHKKNVINLGLIGDDTILPVGQKCVYYLYYKADKDLYLYDSENNIETNLFQLDKPVRGTLKLVANKFKKGILKMFALKKANSKIKFIAIRNNAPVNDQSITVFVKTNPNGYGTLVMDSNKDIIRGDLEITVLTNSSFD